MVNDALARWPWVTGDDGNGLRGPFNTRQLYPGRQIYALMVAGSEKRHVRHYVSPTAIISGHF